MLFLTPKICDLGSPWDLQNQAETRARASFPHIHPITKKSRKSTQNGPSKFHQFSKKSDQRFTKFAESPPTPLYLPLTLTNCNFNHPVGCFPSSTQKPKKSRSGPPGAFRGPPWAPQLGKMMLQGAKRHLKSPFWAEEGNPKKASIPSACF